MFAPLATQAHPDDETACTAPGRGEAHEASPTEPSSPLSDPGGCPAVPGYELLGELGRGRMGVVYKARHLRLNRLVALKVVFDGPHAGPEDRVRFLGEAEALAHCQHPHVVTAYEAGWHAGRPYLAMELAEGGTLAHRCAGTPQSPRQAAELVESLAGAVAHLHARGVVHRDLKPSNVLLTEGGVAKLADFGLAKRLGGGVGLTEVGALLGTPGYMAPEQALCLDVGPPADIYGLGTILYELLTGGPPFRGEGLLHTLQSVACQPPAPPSRVRPGVPRDLEAVCLKCLRKEPRSRYACGEELAEDLRRFLAGQPVVARPPGAWRQAVAQVRRHPFAAGCIVGAAFGMLACLSWSAVGAAVPLGVGGYAAWCWGQSRRLRRKEDSGKQGATRWPTTA